MTAVPEAGNVSSVPDNTTITRSTSREDMIDRLRLARGRGIGPRRFAVLLERCGSAAAALDFLAGPGRHRALGIEAASERTAVAEIEECARRGVRLIATSDPDYPPLLAAIADPPPVLSVLGDPALLHRRLVAIVGARNASAAGARLAGQIAHELGRGGITVASGLARGIDAAAHEGALATGTLAVLAGGVDHVYPPQNRRLYERIAAEGALVSEMRLGTEPQARHFPRRNRIIAGLALGVVVIEAARRSGSLITARIALEEGREVFAVPGSPLDPRSHGGNALIRDGAALTESADDVLRLLPQSASLPPRPVRRAALPLDLDAGEPSGPPPLVDDEETPDGARSPAERVRGCLGAAPVTVDELVRRCQLSPSTVASVLLDLELAGVIERHPGQRVSLA